MRLSAVLTLSLLGALALPPVAAGFNKALGDRLLRETDAIEAQVRAAERKEMVRLAPKGLKPEARRKIRVRLVARDKVIHVGDSFWYRIELQNVGREAIDYWEEPSFLKDGRRYDMGRWNFRATLPDGTTKKMVIGTLAEEWGMADRPKRPLEVPGGERATEAQRQEYKIMVEARREADANLHLTLKPGETLLSRPWRWVSDAEYKRRFDSGEKELWPRPEGPFSELWTAFKFKVPGTYKITLVFDDPPPTPPDEAKLRWMEKRGTSREQTLRMYDEDLRESFGHIEAKPVSLVVVP